MEKNMRMKFLKQRITVILLLVASVCICGNINEFHFFENDYYFTLYFYLVSLANIHQKIQPLNIHSKIR